MFACIYGRRVSKSKDPVTESGIAEAELINLAFSFSPIVEQTTADTVVLDISGQDLLFGAVASQGTPNSDTDAACNVANEIARQAAKLNLKINVAIATNPDVAIHAARSFEGTTLINIGEEPSRLRHLSIKKLDHSLAGVASDRAEEIQATFALWGVRTFGDLASLPLSGVAERLGQEGVRLQRLAQGRSDRRLNLVRPPMGFEQSLALEHPIRELEPLSFILSRLLNQLCANLSEYALATNEVRLRLVTEPRLVGTGSDSDVKHERTITLPVPMRNPKTLLRLLLFDIEAQPPQAAIVAVAISAEPVKPQASQTGLFVPLAPEPEKLEITLARLGKLVGPENVGSPELLDTHRPDAFRIKRFSLFNLRKNVRANPQSASRNPQSAMGFRIFRPPWSAEVRTKNGQPTRINARGAQSAGSVRGQVVCAAGPWRASGDWWRRDVWARDEWDIAVADSHKQKSNVICRIYHDLTNGEWFVAGVYD